MSVLFFVHDGDWAEPPTQNAGADTASWRWWRPRDDGWPPAGPMRWQNCLWWALDRLGGFARPGLAELTLPGATQVLVRVLVTPRWYRFPFMKPADLQIGAIWTHPDARRQGLARAAISEALRRHAGPGQRIWMLADADNAASVMLIRSLGFRLIGTGRRSAPHKIAAIGRFLLSPLDGHQSDRA